jgi:hypothetical protein
MMASVEVTIGRWMASQALKRINTRMAKDQNLECRKKTLSYHFISESGLHSQIDLVVAIVGIEKGPPGTIDEMKTQEDLQVVLWFVGDFGVKEVAPCAQIIGAIAANLPIVSSKTF